MRNMWKLFLHLMVEKWNQSYSEASIPVWDPKLRPQNLKSAKINSSKNRQMTVHDSNDQRERCFELFSMRNSQHFLVICPWTPKGRAHNATPDSPAVQRRFSLLRSSKNRHPPKNAGCGTGNMPEFSKNFPRSDFDHCKLKTKFCKYWISVKPN